MKRDFQHFGIQGCFPEHVMVSNQRKGGQNKSIPLLLLDSLGCVVEIVSGCYVYGGRWVAWLRNNPELLGSAPRHNQLPSLISHISQSCPWILQHLTSTLLELRTSSKSKYSLWILPSKVVFYHFFFPFYFVRSGGTRKEWHCLVTDSARHFVTLTCPQFPPSSCPGTIYFQYASVYNWCGHLSSPVICQSSSLSFWDKLADKTGWTTFHLLQSKLFPWWFKGVIVLFSIFSFSWCISFYNYVSHCISVKCQFQCHCQRRCTKNWFRKKNSQKFLINFFSLAHNPYNAIIKVFNTQR